MSRRISRLRTEPPDRQPVLIVGALLLGLVVGLIAVPRLVGGMDSRAESYLVLASTLFQQGEPPNLLLAASTAAVLLVLGGGLVYFRAMESTIADVV